MRKLTPCVSLVISSTLLLVLASDPAFGQTAADFGSATLRASPTAVTKSGRTCLEATPLLGNSNRSTATASEWARTRAAYPLWESQLQSNPLYRLYKRNPAEARRRIGALNPTYNISDARTFTVRFAKELSGSNKTKQIYYEHRIEGASSSYMSRFSLLMELNQLYKENKFEQIYDLGSRLIQDGNLTARFRPLDREEEDTYFTPQTVDNFIIFFTHMAGIEMTAKQADRLQSSLKYLDDRDALLPLFKLNPDWPSWDAAILKDIAGAAVQGTLRDALAASWRDQDHGYAVIRGRRTHTLDITFAGGGGQKPPTPPSDEFIGANGGFGSSDGAQLVSVAIMSSEMAERAYRKKVAATISRHSNSDGLLYDVQKVGNGVVLHLPETVLAEMGVAVQGGEIKLSRANLQLLQTGQPLSPTHPLTLLTSRLNSRALVQYTNPFQTHSSQLKEDAAVVSFTLQKATPVRVYRDPLNELTMPKVKRLNEAVLGRPQDYVALVADESFGVDDRRVIKEVEAELQQAGVRVVRVSSSTPPPPAITESNVIIITAHSAPELATFVEWLGSNGMLSGKRVLFESCGTALTTELSEEMVQKYKAEAVFVHQGPIHAAKVQEVLVSLASELLKSPGKSMVDEIRELMRRYDLNGIWTISFNMPKANEAKNA